MKSTIVLNFLVTISLVKKSPFFQSNKQVEVEEDDESSEEEEPESEEESEEVVQIKVKKALRVVTRKPKSRDSEYYAELTKKWLNLNSN